MAIGEERKGALMTDGKQKNASLRLFVLGVLALVLITIAGAYAWHSGSRPEDLEGLGYPAVFVVMFISGAGTLFPMPGTVLVLAGGAFWNPLLVGVVAGAGNATGELAAYAVARTGRTALEGYRQPRIVARLGVLSWLRGWLVRHGFLTIIVIAMVPNPLFDFVGLLAGSLGYPAKRFWLACTIGNSLKFGAYALLGEAARSWFPWG